MNDDLKRHIEGIHQELHGREWDSYGRSSNSLKFYVRSLHQHLLEHLSHEEWRQKAEPRSVSFSLWVLGCISLLLAILRSESSDIEWISHNTVAIQLWSVALSTIFVGVSLERSTFVKSLWQFTISKFVLSLIFSGVLFYARGKAAGFINGVFHVDAGAFPITFALTTGLVLFKMLVPFAIALALVTSTAHGLFTLTWLLEKKIQGERLMTPAPYYSLLFVLVAAVILFYGHKWSGGELNDKRIPEKVYLMAHALDFNYTHECANIKPSQPVVFLGNAQESVLVAPYALEDFDFETFFEASADLPEHFARTKCAYKPDGAPDQIGMPQ